MSHLDNAGCETKIFPFVVPEEDTMWWKNASLFLDPQELLIRGIQKTKNKIK